MRKLTASLIGTLLCMAGVVSAQEQFPGDPVLAASNPHISNQFMQLTTQQHAPLRMHTGIDIVTGAGVPVACPVSLTSDCAVANDLSDPNQINTLLLVSRQRQQGDFALFQALHINRNPNIVQSSVLLQGDVLGTVTSPENHLHAEIILTPTLSSGMTLDPYLVHPQVYAFSGAQRWNVDTRKPTVDETIVHPGLSGIPTIFEVRAHDQADADPSVFNGIFEIRLYIDDNLVDDIHFDQMHGRSGEYPFSASDYYYCTDPSCIPTGANDPNKLRHKLLWNTQLGNHIWRLDVYDWNGNLLHGDPRNGLPGREVPVVSMGGTIEDGRVRLTWRIDPVDAREAGIESFSLWRASSHLGEFRPASAEPIPAIDGEEMYTFDAEVPAEIDSVWYRLTAENSIGSTLILSETHLGLPKLVDGLEGYPNPIADRFTIALSLAREANGEIAIFDLGGRRVRVVQRGRLEAGVTRLVWDGRDGDGRALPNGVYLLRVSTDHGPSFTARKIALFR